MRVYRLSESEGIDRLTLTEAETPRPGPYQVLVKMKAVSLNYRDLMVATSTYAHTSVGAGLIPVSDGAGEVVEVGPSVSRVAPGERVCPIFMQRWLAGEMDARHNDSALGAMTDGVLAEYGLFHEDGLVRLPAQLSFEEGATLPCAAVTVWNALYGGPRLGAGQSVLVLGSGGVSVFALQFAHAAGARVLATSTRPAKLETLKELGAAVTIDASGGADWHEAVLEATGGVGVDHIVHTIGGPELWRSLSCIRHSGWVHIVNGRGGTLDTATITKRASQIRGIRVGSRAMFEAMNAAIEVNEIRPVVDRVFPFEDAKAAYRYLDGQSHVGKVVIAIGAD